MKRRLVLGLLLALLLPGATVFANLLTSKHNLSVSGSGTIKANGESQVCIFCHAPHNASPSAPLWNRSNPGSTYTPYSSSTAMTHPGQPTGASLTCLSCHDGTIALGDVLSRTARIAMTATTIPVGKSNLGTDLSDDHPISMAYTASLAAASGGELVDPGSLTGKVKLDASGQMQCTSCHDAHDDSNGKFLVMPNNASALCQTCHSKKYWGNADHKNSSASWNGSGANPWPHTNASTVAANACESCHRPHTAGGKQRLLNSATEEGNCYTCHNGNVAAKNIQSEFTTKASVHPVASTTGVHDPAEAAVISARHVECVDCHNPHASNATSGALSGALVGVRGVDINGAAINPSTAEYQICFRCHADSTNKPAPHTTRQIAQTNTRLEFSTTNPSYHPVVGPGKNSTVPTLLAPWTTTSTIKCSDCHSNDAGPNAGGTGPKGPHGSVWPTMLERQYLTADRTTESAAAYALCYKCHSRSMLIGSGSAFSSHKKHIVDIRTPCNACHDPHGVSSTQGNSSNNSKLVNFDTSIVSPNSAGQLKFVSTGVKKGSCYLRCHGENHNPYNY